jgi:hypothetical protein
MEIIIGIIVIVGLVWFFNKDKDSKVSKPAPAPQPKKPSVAELKKLTKNQLLEMADKKSLKVKKSGSKAAVINELRDQL